MGNCSAVKNKTQKYSLGIGIASRVSWQSPALQDTWKERMRQEQNFCWDPVWVAGNTERELTQHESLVNK